MQMQSVMPMMLNVIRWVLKSIPGRTVLFVVFLNHWAIKWSNWIVYSLPVLPRRGCVVVNGVI